jgi:hypothetical protein
MLLNELDHQFFGQINPKRAAAVITGPERHGKPASQGILLKTYKKIIYVIVIRFADILKSGLCAFEILRTLHFPDKLLDLLSVFFVHTLSF